MAPKRLTNKQRAIIRKQQQQSFFIEPEHLSEPKQGIVSCRHSNQAIIMDDDGEEHRCHLRSNIGDIVVGDNVVWRQGLENDMDFVSKYWDENLLPEAISSPIGLVEQRLDRHNVIERPDHRGQMKTVAANISQIIVVVATEPMLQPTLLDRYLIAIENLGVDAIIVLNKTDIEESLEQARDLLQAYNLANYHITEQLLPNSQNTDEASTTIDHLTGLLEGHTSVFVGQSGTGKSTLINRIIPQANATTGKLSTQNKQGKHTTTQSQLYQVNAKSLVIDSPGIREFGLDGFNEQQLKSGFKEFNHYQSDCKFRNCSHIHEPHCAVINAVEENNISNQRWKSYRYLYAALTEKTAY